MSVKVTAAAVAEGKLVVGRKPGELNVKDFCDENDVSRKTFYKWVERYEHGGVAGLEDRSRRPRSSPNQLDSEIEEAVVRVRKELKDAGLDYGPLTILWHLGERCRRGELSLGRLPSRAGVYRILVRRGQIVAEPRKKPKTALRRFEAPAPNEWWQIDAMDWVIATGVVKVFNILDDHSRVLVRSRVALGATSEEAWITFSQATATWGMPAGVLSDNGLCFSGKLRGMEVLFEARLRDVGIKPFTGRPYHPQTTGKVERFQQTLKKWLTKQPLAPTMAALQAQLDRFEPIYNRERPHQGIGRVTPIQRWQASPASGPASEPLAHPSFPSQTGHGVVLNGSVVAGKFLIHLGVEHEGRPTTTVIDGNRANVFIDDQLVRHLELDPTRRYQPSGRRRGGPRRARLQS